MESVDISTPVLVCQSKVSIRDLITQTAEKLQSQQAEQAREVKILGKEKTIGKAISVTEIVKRAFQETDGCESALSQQTKIYRKEFNGKKKNCIEITLSLSPNRLAADVLRNLVEQNPSDKQVKHVNVQNARHFQELTDDF